MKITLMIRALLIVLLSGCVPRIEIAAPEKPLTINMNIKIDHEILIKADKNATSMLKNSNVPTTRDLKTIESH